MHIWEARAWDDSGNMVQSLSLLVRVANQPDPPSEDRTPPVIEWISPNNNDELSNIIELQILAHDNDRVDSVAVYLNGHSPESWHSGEQHDSLYYFDWDTEAYDDGQYLLEARAWEEVGNLSLSPTLLVTVRNTPLDTPRVIWVPDEYELIQEAIWASEDGDTIMVRTGEYRESLQMFDKNVSLISESGPEETTINSSGLGLTLRITGGQDTTMIVRGFNLYHVSEERSSCISVNGSSPLVVNNIFIGPGSENTGIFAGQNAGKFINNLFIDIWIGTQMFTCWGVFCNNMILNAYGYGFWSSAV